MRTKSRGLLALILGTLTVAGVAEAEVTFELIGECLATDISADGTIVVGNLLNYETFRWTAAGGVVPGTVGRRETRSAAADVVERSGPWVQRASMGTLILPPWSFVNGSSGRGLYQRNRARHNTNALGTR